MTLNYPESSYLNEPHKIEGKMKEARRCFYELAQDKVKYLNSQQIAEWKKNITGEEGYITSASYIINYNTTETEDGDFDKWINNLEIVINTDVFKINGEDYSDLIPIFLEHDIYEAWLTAKKRAGSKLDLKKKHLLARRQELRLAEELGLSDKLEKWFSIVNPQALEEVRYALNKVRKQIKNITT